MVQILMNFYFSCELQCPLMCVSISDGRGSQAVRAEKNHQQYFLASLNAVLVEKDQRSQVFLQAKQQEMCARDASEECVDECRLHSPHHTVPRPLTAEKSPLRILAPLSQTPFYNFAMYFRTAHVPRTALMQTITTFHSGATQPRTSLLESYPTSASVCIFTTTFSDCRRGAGQRGQHGGQLVAIVNARAVTVPRLNPHLR